MPTVIDKLVVTLGLDTTAYKKGEKDAENLTKQTGETLTAAQKKQGDQRGRIEKEQQARTKETGNIQKKVADQTVKGFKDIALGAGALLLGFNSVKGFINLLGDLNTSEAGLGRLGKNLAIDPHVLNTWGIAAGYIGGKAEDVQASLATVSQAITNLQVKGEVSPLFYLAQRFGLDVLHIKDKTEFLLKLGDKLREYGQKFGRDAAFNISGLDATTFNLITDQNARGLLAKAEAQNVVTEKTSAQAAANQAELEQAKATGKKLATRIGHAVTPYATHFALGLSQSLENQADAGVAAYHGDFATAWKKLKESAGFKSADDVVDANKSRGIANNNPGNIRAVGNQARDEKGFRKFTSIYEGLSAMDSQLDRYANRGINTIRKIVETYAPAKDGNDVEAYVKALTKATGKGENDVLGKSDRPALLRGMQLRETGKSAKVNAALKQTGFAATPALNRAATAAGGKAGGNQTTVTVGEVKIQTQATDAPGIARDFANSVKRQTYAAQANTGQT